MQQPTEEEKIDVAVEGGDQKDPAQPVMIKHTMSREKVELGLHGIKQRWQQWRYKKRLMHQTLQERWELLLRADYVQGQVAMSNAAISQLEMEVAAVQQKLDDMPESTLKVDRDTKKLLKDEIENKQRQITGFENLIHNAHNTSNDLRGKAAEKLMFYDFVKHNF